MKKIFTVAALCLMTLCTKAQTVINLAGLQTADFTYDETYYATSTYTDETTQVTSPSFTYKGGGKYSALELTGKGVKFNYKNSSEKTNFFILNPDYFTAGGKGVQLILTGLKAGQTITLNVAAKADGSTPTFGASNATVEGDVPALDTKNEFADISYKVSADGDVTITESAKGYNIKSITITDGVVDPNAPVVSYLDGASWTLSKRDGTSVDNCATYSDGYKLELTGKDDKAFGTGKALTIEGNSLTSIKLSNGAQNTITLPDGKVATKVTFYSYVNKKQAEDAEGGSYWKEVAGTEYNADEATKMAVFTDTPDYQKNPDVISFDLDRVSSFTFTNKGQQPCVVIAVTAVSGSASGIQSVQTSVINMDGTMYNLSGQKVGADYKGLVIKNGKKVVIK